MTGGSRWFNSSTAHIPGTRSWRGFCHFRGSLMEQDPVFPTPPIWWLSLGSHPQQETSMNAFPRSIINPNTLDILGSIFPFLRQ